jgi:hypothetical protein
LDVGEIIGMLAVGGFFAWMISLSPVGKALAERLRRGAPQESGVEDVRAALDALRGEVAELAERVDFTERLLSKHREVERLPPPR